MRIECLTTFLDGTDRFEKGDVRTVDDARAQRFVDEGWAVPFGMTPEQAAATGSVTLAIQNSSIGLGDSNG